MLYVMYPNNYKFENTEKGCFFVNKNNKIDLQKIVDDYFQGREQLKTKIYTRCPRDNLKYVMLTVTQDKNTNQRSLHIYKECVGGEQQQKEETSYCSYKTGKYFYAPHLTSDRKEEIRVSRRNKRAMLRSPQRPY